MSLAISGIRAEVQPSFATGASHWQMDIDHRIDPVGKRHPEQGRAGSGNAIEQTSKSTKAAEASAALASPATAFSEPSAIISPSAGHGGVPSSAPSFGSYRQAANLARRGSLPIHKQVPSIHGEDSGFADRLIIDPRDHGIVARELVGAISSEGFAQQMVLSRFKKAQPAPLEAKVPDVSSAARKAIPQKIALTRSTRAKSQRVTEQALTRALTAIIEHTPVEFVEREVAEVDTPAIAVIMDEVRKIFLSANLRSLRFHAPKASSPAPSSLYTMQPSGAVPLRTASIARTALTA